MKPRLAVVLCGCAGNISNKIDLDQLAKELQDRSDVTLVSEHSLLCSAAGRQAMAEQLRAADPTHVVIGACSPRDHEETFRQLLQQVGINPHLLQLANLREQCSWVTEDPRDALAKARALLRAALRRVVLQEELSAKQIPCRSDMLIIGGGIAGVEAARSAARAGRRATLVEASASLGGRVAQLEEVAPQLECAPCLFAPRLAAVASSEGIRVLTNANLTGLIGYLGNFTATIEIRARLVDVDSCIGCDECAQACPADMPDPFNLGASRRKAIQVPFPGATPNSAVIERGACLRFAPTATATQTDCDACVQACPLDAVRLDQQDQTIKVEIGSVIVACGAVPDEPAAQDALGAAVAQLDDVYTLAQLERVCSATGPTGGTLTSSSGCAPRRVAVIHCVGRTRLGYCSGLCCEAALKVSSLLQRVCGHRCEVVHLHSDLVLSGPAATNLRARAAADGATFVHVADPEGTKVSRLASGLVVEIAQDGGTARRIEADLVVLATGLVPHPSSADLAARLDIERDQTGFMLAPDPLIAPMESSVEGIFLAGCSSGPKSVAQSVLQAQAAVAAALSRTVPGRSIRIDPMVAQQDVARCSGCLACVSVCPFKACHPRPDSEGTGRVTLDESICRGCGICAAACPSGAAEVRQFTEAQLAGEIEEVLRD